MVAIEVKAYPVPDRVGFRIFPRVHRDARRNGHFVASVHGSQGLPRDLLLAGPGVRVGSPDRAGLLESPVDRSEVELAGGLSL